jgi:hypothetical protein
MRNQKKERIKLPITSETIEFTLKLPNKSVSGKRQPCNVQIMPYCLILRQTDKNDSKNEILLSETQFEELRRKIYEIDESYQQTMDRITDQATEGSKTLKKIIHSSQVNNNVKAIARAALKNIERISKTIDYFRDL